MRLLISFCLFNYGVNVVVKFDLSIEKFIYLKLIGKESIQSDVFI
ncbi:MAG: hypothetical protein JWR50_3520 [Mucilaginibacter sp.]|nr:hypothetical protein [Mucilaginibacter sp.]